MVSEKQIMIISFYVAIFLFTSIWTNDAEGVDVSSWEVGEEMPTHRTEIAADLLDNRIYVLGGADYQKDGVIDTVEVYDPEKNTWTTAAPLPIPIDHTSAVAYNGKLYLVGGFLENKISTDKLFIYDPNENKWTEGNPLPSPRGALTAEVINGTIYAMGGVNKDHQPVNTNEAYDVKTNTWTAREPIPGPKHHVASAVVDGKLYVLGGRLFGNGEPSEINESLTNFDDNWRYDPEKNKWMPLESMSIRRSGFTATSLNDQIYVFGGQGTEGSYNSVERYDPITNKWYGEPAMPTERSGSASVAYKDRIYVFGGQHKGLEALNVNEIFIQGK